MECAMSEQIEITATEDEYLRQDELSRLANECIKKHSIYAAAGGLIPIPFIEMATSSTIQLRMIAQLSDIYDIRFSENAVKNAIGTLIATVLPMAGAAMIATNIFRSFPVIGTAVSVLTVPTLGAASTYALGKVFAAHFASGGTTLNFNAEAAKAAFKEKYEEGKRKASEFIGRAKPASSSEVAA
jgi:uncharacterized protein (DUF697 family)